MRLAGELVADERQRHMLTGGEGVGRADETGPDQAVADKLLGKGYGAVEHIAENT